MLIICADVAFIYGVPFTYDGVNSYIKKYADMSYDEFIDRWRDYVCILDTFEDVNTNYILGVKIYIYAYAPLKEDIEYNKYNMQFRNVVAAMFPKMPEDVYDNLCADSGFLADVRWL